jgi:hypothetical protein
MHQAPDRLTYEKEKEAEEKEVEHGSGQIGIIHKVLIYPRERVQHSKRLPISDASDEGE